ncbi:MAG: HAMP domain-containing sensor histidine kinase [Flavobacteriales bacterium]|jgi:two-component system phosphate regulon sensor histidine kinase PhoR|tara:strand:- start:8347 stop:9615 length:1269 start_codon:yes stop_codon:yes gene_type:complete
MSRKSIYLVVFLATISLTGIIVTQIFWVDKAFTIQDREFNDRTVIALTSVVERIQVLNKDSSDVDEPVVQETSNYFVAHVNDTLHPYLLESLLKEEFQSSLLKQNFEYVIYDCFNDSIVFGSKVNVDQPDNIVKSEDVTPHKKLNRDGHYFGVYFPEKKGYIMDQMGIWMFSSFIILLVVLFFAYSIMAILKQKRLSEIKTDFINNMTHELKTPISTISISTRALLNVSNMESVEKYARIIKTENERLQNQVERVLDIATLSPNTLNLDKKHIYIHKLLEEITESLELKLAEVDGKLYFNFQAQSEIVYSDKLHLTNIFTNLIDNAIKYCEQSPEIKIHTSQLKNKIIILIEDNGIGIDKKHYSMIFEKFFRVPSGDKHDVKGFGLGLFYVKSVLEALDGSIKLIKSDSTGSTFKIELQHYG